MAAEQQEYPLRLLVGLGNPGPEYHETRHNVGFMLLDRVARKAGVTFKVEKKWKAEVARAGSLWLCKPLTYMNISGEAVQPLAHFQKIDPREMLIVFDDMALPFGKLRIRPSGSAGGHNGLRSIIQCFGADTVPRLRIGIGAARPGAAVSHVLGKFSPEERVPLEESLSRAEDAVQYVRERGLQPAMNAFN